MNNCLNYIIKVVMTLKKKKKASGLTEISMRESNYCMFFMEANRSKVFEIID